MSAYENSRARCAAERLRNAVAEHAEGPDCGQPDCLLHRADPRDALAAAGAGSAAYLNPEGTDFESLADYRTRVFPPALPLHRTEAGYPNCSTCDGGGCYDCTDPA